MFKKLLHNLKSSWKIFILFLLLSCILAGSLAFLYYEIITYLNTNYFIDPHIISFLKYSFIRLTCIGLILYLLICLIYRYDVLNFFKRLNITLKESLADRKLENHFNNLYSAKTYDSAITNILATFSLFKSFDNMKSAQFSIETNCIKTLINNIHEGIILVNKEKVVTHINHPSETLLGLIPGEILDQTISRKISNPDILSNLDKVIEDDHRVIDQEITLKGNKLLNLNIFPIKNRLGEIERAIIILEPLIEEEPQKKEKKPKK
jgi:signal transduction histidine kinase